MGKDKISKHLIIISIDALNYHDFEYLKTLPNFKTFIEEGAYIREVSSIYPTSTYPCHTSIITGCFPNRHGIYSNEQFTPSMHMNQPWFWYKKDIKAPTLFDLAKNAGLITANILWPVMAGARIDYNLPEIWSVKNESFLSLFWKYGSRSMLPMLLRYLSLFKGKEQPNLDNFSEALAKHLILHKRPHLLTLHLTELDHERHVLGLSDPGIKDALVRIDERIGNIIRAAQDASLYDETTFVLLGDHGTNDYEKIVYLNTFFHQEGLLEIDRSGNILTWKVYASAAGGSVQIHNHPECTAHDILRIHDTIGKLSVMLGTPIKQTLTKEQADIIYNLKGDFDYVLEAKDGFIFKNAVTDQLIKHRASVEGSYRAEHGYLPTHPNQRTLFMAKGKSIKPGSKLQKACIVDEGPTFAEIIGLKMDEDIDGIILHDILAK